MTKFKGNSYPVRPTNVLLTSLTLISIKGRVKWAQLKIFDNDFKFVQHLLNAILQPEVEILNINKII